MDWTFWLGLVGIVALWLLIRWGNGLWRRHAERAHRRAEETAGPESSPAAEPSSEQRDLRAWFERPLD